MWLAGGAIGVSAMTGAVSPEYRIYRFGTDVEPRFIHHLLRSAPYMRQYKLLVRAETTFDRRVTKEDFRELPLLLPPSTTQRAIADYLDTETARIDALIKRKRRMVELLVARLSAFISTAVTTGLDDHVPPVLTDNEFAPAIPETWILQRLRHLVTGIVDTAHKTAPVVDGGKYLIVRTSNVKSGRLVLDGARYTDEKTWREWTMRDVPRPGDVMFTREAPAGEACLVPADVPLCIGQRMVLLKVDQAQVTGEWLMHSIYSGPAQRFIEVLSKATTVAHLNMGDIPNIPVAVPPLVEQERILGRIRDLTDECDSLSTRLLKQIDLLVERRQALITAAVSGELNISGVEA
jgi:type I restriction enzyme S subunit